MPRYPQTTVDTLEAIAVALAVFKSNDHQVKKFENGVPGNKEQILAHFTTDAKVSDLDLEAAQEVKQGIEHFVTMATISGHTIPEFTISVFDAIKEETISNRSFGIIAWAPKLARDIKLRLVIKDEIYRMGLSSRYFATEHSKVRVTYQEISSKYLPNYNTYTHTGVDEHGNFLSFYNKKKIASGSIIQGKVKSNGTGRNLFAGINMTYLHYVKEVK